MLKFQHYKYLEKSYKNKLLSKDEFDYSIKSLNFNKSDYYQFIDNYIEKFKSIRNFKKDLVSFSITKCTIAHCNGLSEPNVEKYKNYFNKFSNFSHPNIFVNLTDISHRIIESKDLLLLDLEILKYSLACLISYNTVNFSNIASNNIIHLFNSFEAYISNINLNISKLNNITINN